MISLLVFTRLEASFSVCGVGCLVNVGFYAVRVVLRLGECVAACKNDDVDGVEGTCVLPLNLCSAYERVSVPIESGVGSYCTRTMSSLRIPVALKTPASSSLCSCSSSSATPCSSKPRAFCSLCVPGRGKVQRPRSPTQRPW